MDRTFVIIVNYRQPVLTECAVASLENSGGKCLVTTVVVDNGSADGSLERLKKSCAGCTVIDAGGNLGFSGGNNVGIRYALEHGAEYILLLNNDAVLERGAVEALLAAAGPKMIAAPKIVFASDPSRAWYGGGHVSRMRGGFYHDADAMSAASARDVDFASGCCMLLPAAFFRECGLMDERFFLYCEDAELCLRAARAGYRIRYEPRAVVRHKVSASTGGERSPMAAYYGTRNRLMLLSQYRFPPAAFAYVLATRLVKLLSFPFHPAERYVLPGIIDWLAGRTGRKEVL